MLRRKRVLSWGFVLVFDLEFKQVVSSDVICLT